MSPALHLSEHGCHDAHSVTPRYWNMDYIVLSTLSTRSKGLQQCTLSYDIACQWSKHFHD